MKKYEIITLAFAAFLLTMASCRKDDDSTNGLQNGNGEMEVLWHNRLEVPVNPHGTSFEMPTLDEQDNIYIMSNDMSSGYALKAFDKDGNILWDKPGAGNYAVNEYVAYRNNRLYFTASESMWDFGTRLISLHANDGSLAWDFQLPDSLWYMSKQIAITDNKVLITMRKNTASHSYLFAFDPSNGNITGTLPITENFEDFAIAVKGSTAYLTSDKLYSINLNTMEVNWSVWLPGNDDDNRYSENHYSFIGIAGNGNISFSYQINQFAEDRGVVTYSPSGEQLWNREIKWLSNYISIDNHGHVLVSCNGGKLFKLNGSNGDQIWQIEVPFIGSFNDLILANDGTMYSGDVYGIYGVDENGDLKYHLENKLFTGLNATNLSNISLLGNGNIIVLAMDRDAGNGHIFCLKAGTGGIKAEGWAKSGGNAFNTLSLN